MKNARHVVAWIAVGLLVLFIVMNLQETTLNLFFSWIQIRMPLSLMIIGFAGLGAGAAWFLKKHPPPKV